MIDVQVKDIMIPISKYVSVKRKDNLIMVLQALEEKRQSGIDHAHRDAIVVDSNGVFIGKITMIDIFRALEPNYKKIYQESKTGVLTKEFVMKMVKDFNLWLEPAKDICSRGGNLTVADVMYIPKDLEFVDETDSLEIALHNFVMGAHQPLVVKKGDDVTGVLRFGDVYEVVRKTLLSCAI